MKTDAAYARQFNPDHDFYRNLNQYREDNIPMLKIVEGVWPDAATVTNANRAKQSAIPYRMDLLPARATLAAANVLHHGAEKYGANNWRGIPVEDHLNHALSHAYAHLAGDTQDDHLEHFACRAMMALEILLTSGTK